MNAPSDFIERFNQQGGPIPIVDSDHLPRMWNLMCELNARSANRPGHDSGARAIGLGAAGIENISRDEASALGLRFAMLESFVERNVVREYVDGDQVRAQVFRAIASFPCDKEEFGEAVLQLQLKKLPPEQSAQLRSSLMAEGYNPEEPKVDAKFLEWIRSANT